MAGMFVKYPRLKRLLPSPLHSQYLSLDYHYVYPKMQHSCATPTRNHHNCQFIHVVWLEMTAPIDCRRVLTRSGGPKAIPNRGFEPGSPPRRDPPSGADWLEAYGALRRRGAYTFITT